MSMFYVIYGSGFIYDDSDDGVSVLSEPEHVTREGISNLYSKRSFNNPYWYPVNTDKAKCENVQTIYLNEDNGRRTIQLLVKAMGYGHAYERAREYCDIVYPQRLRGFY